MPGSTGPDRNTYTIPEVQLGDTFNFWRDATNTAIYKLNKLKIYDATSTGSIGVTYGSTGAWNAFLQPTITEGLTFTQRIVFSTGITTAGVYSSRGITAAAGIWTIGGLSADRVYVSGSATFASITDHIGLARFVGGLSASNIYGSGGSTFASGVAFLGGLSASNIYGSGGSTFGSTLYVAGGATFANTVSVSGNFAVDTNTLFVDSNNNRVGVGTITPGASLDVNGNVRIVSAGTTAGGSGVVHPLIISNNAGTISAFFGDSTSTSNFRGNSYSAALRFNGSGVAWGDIAYYPQGRTGGFVSGGGEFRFTKNGSDIGSTANAMVSVGELLSEGQIYAGATATFNSVVYVAGGATFNSTTDHAGVARFAAGITTTILDVTNAARFNGGLSASAIYGSRGSTFASGVAFLGGLSASNIYGSGGSTFGSILYVAGGATFNSTTDHAGVARPAAGITTTTLDVTNAARFNGGATASTLQVSGNATVGSNATGATLGVCGSVSLLARTPLRFADTDSTHYVAFQAPATVASNVVWTLPSADGTNGQVLSTNASGVLSWKAADGVTGTNKQVQFNQGGTLGATAGFVFEYAAATGVCAGTLGLSGGLYCNNNVAIGLSQGAMTGRIYGTNSTAKLEVRGDIRIPSSGFFVTKGMTLPTATETVIEADENAFIAGRLSIPSGATLTIQTDGSLVIL
jgi:hypothetical protein